ncbi:M20/M25/M40 family metallo-hydrolase [bacterium]|nr:M20/M25/M40 family metallo-hydrolase [bacterium]
MIDRLRELVEAFCVVPGLSGHERRIRMAISDRLPGAGEGDALGNLWLSFPGDPTAPSVMVFTHMDQLGFVVRKIEADGFLRLERLGGVPERALPSQAVTICGQNGDIAGLIANKSHHATSPDEKYQVVRYPDLYVDAGFSSKAEAEAAGVQIGCPVVYRGHVMPLAGNRIAGTAIDDRAGCAALVLLAEALAKRDGGPTVHVCFTVQEEFNLRGAQPLAQRLNPDIAIQIDLMLASDTPDMADRGDMRLGGGPGISLYSFHGRGTLNGVIPHPAMVKLFEDAAAVSRLTLQRSAQSGVLTDLSYVQLQGEGVVSIDVGFPMRYSHSSLEVCDLSDLAGLVTLLRAALEEIGPDFDVKAGR